MSKRTVQVLIELDISAMEEYVIIVLLWYYNKLLWYINYHPNSKT